MELHLELKQDYLELLTPEIKKLLGCTKNKDGENVPHLEI